MRGILVFGLVLMILVGCKKSKDELKHDDYLIFGHFFGFCFGEECIEMYKITKSKLYEDKEDLYGQEAFDFIEVPVEKFDLVKDLVTDLPQNLIDSPDSTFGCPDCADQGGIYIEYRKNDVVHKWKIDNDNTPLPAYLQEFKAKVKTKIELINS